MLKFKPRTTKLTKHRSSPPSGMLPLSPSHIHIYSHRGNRYRWPSDAFATIPSSPFWAAAPKGPMTYAFTNAEFFPPSPSMSPPPPPASRPKFQPWTQISSLRPKFQPQRSNPSLEAQFPAWSLNSQLWGLTPSFEAQISASWLKF